MAKAKISIASIYTKKSKSKGLAAKTKTSTNKRSKLYKKPYRGQGR